MHKSLLLLVALGSTAALGAFALPAAAESGEGACAASPSTSEPLNLDAIPSKPVTGKQAVQGVGDDECDDASAVDKATDDGLRASVDAEDDAGSREDLNESETD
jgi:hypothetical protein